MNVVDRFVVTKCDLVEIIFEIIRFLSHITILHFLNCLANDDNLFEMKYMKIMLFTALSVIIYHIFIKKILINKNKKMKLICNNKENN